MKNMVGFLVIALLAVLSNGCASTTATPTNTAPPPTFTIPPPTFTPTTTLTPTPTLTPTNTPSPTATPNIAATQQYEDFVAIVQQIYDAGQISTLDGEYIKLDDYSDEYAVDYGYKRTLTGVNAKSFIIRADFDWEVANIKNYSGCGYSFRQELVSSPGTTYDVGYQYIVVLDGVNGILLMYQETFGHQPAQALKIMKKPDMGSNPYYAQFTLVVTDTSAYTYVNGNFFTEHKLKQNWITASGPLNYLVLTGSAADYGTRCKITNVELWIIEP